MGVDVVGGGRVEEVMNDMTKAMNNKHQSLQEIRDEVERNVLLHYRENRFRITSLEVNFECCF